MRKPHTFTICIKCGRRSSTTILKTKNSFVCQKCRGIIQDYQRPSFFKRVSDKMLEIFGS